MNLRRGLTFLAVLASAAVAFQGGAHATSTTRLKAAVDAVSADSAAASAAALSHDAAALAVDCRAVRDDAGVVMSMTRPKLLTKSSWRRLMGAMSGYYNAAALCIGATKGRKTPSVPLLSAAADALDDATYEMNLAIATL